jgi:tetratricopeptide (TPR) repeat protein
MKNFWRSVAWKNRSPCRVARCVAIRKRPFRVHLQNNDTILKAGIILFLTIAVLAIYWQVDGHQFINYDDEDYILTNSRLQLGFTVENIHWLLTSSYASNWHPITWFSHILDVKLFGINPAGHHFVNVALHTINSILLFLFLRRFTGSIWRSAAVAVLFAIHPLNVESVAWIAERKNVLSSTFWIITLYLYAKFTERKSIRFYILAIFAFTLGLMSKQMLVSIPFVLLLLDYWPLQRISGKPPKYLRSSEFKWLLLEKVPFLFLAVAASGIALISQQNAMTPLLASTMAERLANASISYFQYIRKIFWPSDLALFYPFPESIHIREAIISALLLLIVTTTVLKFRRNYPYLFAGWFWYLITLIPVIGIVRIGLQSMADRYAYIPSIGIFIIIVWLISDFTSNIPRRSLILWGVSAILFLLLSVSAWLQTSYWKDSMTLFTHTLTVTERNYVALCTIGRVFERGGKPDEALQKFDEAIEIAPWYEYAQTHRDLIMANRGKVDAAVFKYNEVILQNPTAVKGHINLGIIMGLQGNLEEAVKNFRIALDFDPRSAAANYNLGLTLYRLGKNDEATKYFLKSLETNPDDFECHYSLGAVLENQGRYKDAIRHLREALRLNPGYLPAKDKLELILQKKKSFNMQ